MEDPTFTINVAVSVGVTTLLGIEVNELINTETYTKIIMSSNMSGRPEGRLDPAYKKLIENTVRLYKSPN